MTDNRSFTCIHRVPNPIEANLLKGLLEHAGIPVQMTGEGLVGAYSGLPKVGDVRLLVPERYLQAAKAVLSDYEKRVPVAIGESWSCTDCGELNEPQFGVCWRCEHIRSDT
ncbi:MAG: DUF2007 domain-containing protein [Gammaproteobacteria bacterium]